METIGDYLSLRNQVRRTVEDAFRNSKRPGSYEDVTDPWAAYGFRIDDVHVEHALRLSIAAVQAIDLVAAHIDENSGR